MHLSNFIRRASERFPDCKIGSGADQSELAQAENRLGVSFPGQVRDFYKCCNGILFPHPFLRVLPLSEMQFADCGKFLVFCYAGRNEPIAFDTTKPNAAHQWFITGVSEEHQITFTMASFWSSKIWGWLEYGRPIWSISEYERSEQNAPSNGG